MEPTREPVRLGGGGSTPSVMMPPSDVRDLADRVREAAYLEGDFLLRSGRRSRFYLDKYRFETRPDLLRDLGRALADRVAAVEPEATRLAGPELGAVALVAATALHSDRPFLIVRKDAKDYGTGRRIEGVWSPGERVVLIEDVVTSGGAALGAVAALRSAGLRCETVICVVDRGEGGGEAMGSASVRLESLLDAAALRLGEASSAGVPGTRSTAV